MIKPPSHLHPPPEVDFLALWIEALSLLLVLNLRIRLHFLHLGDPNCPCRLNSSGSATLLHASAFRVAPVYRQPIAKGANTISCRLDLCPPPLRKTSCNWIFEIHSWQAFGQILLRAPTLCLFPHTACFADSIYIKESGSLTFFDFFFFAHAQPIKGRVWVWWKVLYQQLQLLKSRQATSPRRHPKHLSPLKTNVSVCVRYLCSQGWKVLQVFRCYETHIYVSVEVPNARCAENNRVVWVKRRTEDVWGWKRCTQQSSFSLTALSHGHTLLSQSTHSYNSCFVSWVMFCSAVVSLWGVFFLPL